jgi:hypothetical protein
MRCGRAGVPRGLFNRFYGRRFGASKDSNEGRMGRLGGLGTCGLTETLPDWWSLGLSIRQRGTVLT